MLKSYISDIQLTKLLRKHLFGHVIFEDKNIAAQLIFLNGDYVLKIDKTIDLEGDDRSLIFISDDSRINISATVIQYSNSVMIGDSMVSSQSEAKVHSFSNKILDNSPAFHRSYYLASSRLLYDLCGNTSELELSIKGFSISLRHQDEFLVIENKTKMKCEQFSEIAYMVLISVGFISGKFLQDFCYTFSRSNNDNEDDACTYRYQRFRKGSSSMYHAIAANPYGYKYLIGSKTADELYKNGVLKPIDPQTLSRLCETVLDSDQLQYALVLFNDASGNDLTLLIKNNCFFVVIEVLIKYFERKFKSKLPRQYSQLGNVLKFESLFGMLFKVTDREVELYRYRNKLFHGDIEEIEGSEMFNVMLKQISLIYKIVLAHVDFDGSVIDHYALRNNLPGEAFVRIL